MNASKTSGAKSLVTRHGAQVLQSTAVTRKFSKTQQPHSHGQAARSAVKVHIEELVLHGFPHGGRFQIGDVVEHELSRLFSERGYPQSLAETASRDYVDAGTFRLSHEARPSAIGTQIANSVLGGLAR